jgi:hypothetical protein
MIQTRPYLFYSFSYIFFAAKQKSDIGALHCFAVDNVILTEILGSTLKPLGTVRPIYRTGTPLPSKLPYYIFFQQISVLNILNTLHNLRFFLFKMPFIS